MLACASPGRADARSAAVGTSSPAVTGTSSPSQTPTANGSGAEGAPDPVTGLEAQPTPDFSVSLNPDSLTLLVNAGGSSSPTVTVAPLNGFTGDVTLTASGSGGISCGVSPTDVTLGPTQTSSLSITVPSSTPAGVYSVIVTGTCGSLSHTATFTMNVSDFSLSINPTAVTVVAHSSSTATVSVNGVYGFKGSVTLAALGTPNGLGVAFSGSPVSGSGSSVATFAATAGAVPGTYVVTIQGTSGSLVHTATISVTIVDFSLSVNPTTVSIPPGGSGGATVTVNSVDGFTGSVSLSTSSLPSGVTASFAPTSVSAGGTSTLTFTASQTAGPGPYIVTITGTYNGTPQSTSIVLNITDFTISANPTTLTTSPGGSKSTTISLSPLYGFTGSAALSVSNLPPGFSAGFSPTSVSSGTPSTLTLTTDLTVAQGTYTVTVAGLANGITRNTTVTVNVTVPQVTVTIGNLQDVYVGVPASTSATASMSILPGGYSASQLTASWSYGTIYISYSATGNDETWADPGDGSTASVTLTGASTDPAGTFTGTFNTLGYYEVCIAATVSYYNPTTGENFGPYTGFTFATNNPTPTGNAVAPSFSGVQPASTPAGTPAGPPDTSALKVKTSALPTVTPSVASIKLGLGSPTAATTQIFETITPSSAMRDVKFVVLKNSDYSTISSEVTVTPAGYMAGSSTATVLLTITAASKTPASTQGTADAAIVPEVMGKLIYPQGSTTPVHTDVLVIAPSSVVHSVVKAGNVVFNGYVTGRNDVLNSATSPYDPNVIPDRVQLAVLYVTPVTMQVNDQFNVPLDKWYAGVDVYEQQPGDTSPHNLNSPLSMNGTYIDPAGDIILTPFYAPSASDPTATSWKNDSGPSYYPSGLPTKNKSASYSITVGGQSAGSFYRTTNTYPIIPASTSKVQVYITSP